VKVLPKPGTAAMHRELRKLIDFYGLAELLNGLGEACMNIGADQGSRENAGAWDVQAEFLFELPGKMNADRDDLPKRRKR